MGLFALPTDDVPAGGRPLVACTAVDDDGALEVHVEAQFLTPRYVHDDNLVFNVEGYGRFRLWLEPGAPAPRD